MITIVWDSKIKKESPLTYIYAVTEKVERYLKPIHSRFQNLEGIPIYMYML